jgi:hypothetical protein
MECTQNFGRLTSCKTLVGAGNMTLKFILERWAFKMEDDGICSGSSPMEGLGIGNFEPFSSATRDLVS